MSYYDFQDGRAAGLRDGFAERSRLRDTIEAKDEAIRILGESIHANALKLGEKQETINALQQSLDEATAKINSNTPETFINYPVKRRTFAPQPQPEPDVIEVGDLVRYKGGVNHYIVERIFPVEPGSLYPDNPKLMLRHIGTRAVYYGRPKNLVKLS